MSRRMKAILQLNLQRVSQQQSQQLIDQDALIVAKLTSNVLARRDTMCLRCQEKFFPCTGRNGIFGCSFCAAQQAPCRWVNREAVAFMQSQMGLRLSNGEDAQVAELLGTRANDASFPNENCVQRDVHSSIGSTNISSIITNTVPQPSAASLNALNVFGNFSRQPQASSSIFHSTRQPYTNMTQVSQTPARNDNPFANMSNPTPVSMQVPVNRVIHPANDSTPVPASTVPQPAHTSSQTSSLLPSINPFVDFSNASLNGFSGVPAPATEVNEMQEANLANNGMADSFSTVDHSNPFSAANPVDFSFLQSHSANANESVFTGVDLSSDERVADSFEDIYDGYDDSIADWVHVPPSTSMNYSHDFTGTSNYDFMAFEGFNQDLLAQA